MTIHGNTSQYMAIHEFINSRFFRGIYVGMAIHVLQYMVIHDDTWQYMAIQGNTWQYMTS